MAKYKNGIMGAFNGTIGPVVGYEWKGRSCMRSLGMVHNPRTERQQANRALFSATSKLAAQMKEATAIGLHGVAVEAKNSEKNIFVSLNRHCVSLAEETITVDYPQLLVAQGELPSVQFGSPHLTEGRQVRVDFQPGCQPEASASDYVYLYAFAPTLNRGCLSIPARRRDRHITESLPARWEGHTIHLYGFTWDHKLSASNSTYLGTLFLS